MFQTRSRLRAVRALERSVTMWKLQLLLDSNPAIPMVHDFSQAEDRPAQVSALPPHVLASPARTEADELQEIIGTNPFIVPILTVTQINY